MREFGIIGRPLGHSASARHFTAKFENEGLDCHFEQYELPSIEALPELLERVPLEGFNVTIPYKQQVMRYLDGLSDEAAKIGAVNCVRRHADGRMIGHNTDIIGLRVALAELLDGVVPEHALVLGTGGASQAVQYALTELGIPFDLISRDPAKGNYTYDNLPVEVVAESKLIINATPVGTWPNVEEAPRIPYAYLTPEHHLLDLVYNPPLTQFLDYGQQRGAKIMNGERMFLGQAAAGWAIWNE
ncbi:MAG: shikimate dehydrogenase [Alistipes sp.]|nr:shikimate dehydrogenase [Rikenellaceae bacterium]MBO5350678.1 shikimate dehydrogenase [Alistipes sp.]MBQ2843650.1 shikimate dehydrogenase [Alistipes sp.]MBR4052036.1 shikimate dehydrogenase [Alistipes sp.]